MRGSNYFADLFSLQYLLFNISNRMYSQRTYQVGPAYTIIFKKAVRRTSYKVKLTIECKIQNYAAALSTHFGALFVDFPHNAKCKPQPNSN